MKEYISTYSTDCQRGHPISEILSTFSLFLNLFLFLSDYIIFKNTYYTENFEKQRVTPPYHVYKSFKNVNVPQNIPRIISSSCSCLCIFEDDVCALRVKRQTDFHSVLLVEI